MDRSDKYTKTCDIGGTSKGFRTKLGHDEQSNYLDHEIVQLTKLRSGPNERLSRVVTSKLSLPVSPVKMLAGREGNYSGRGRFSSADSCHVLSRYLPCSCPSRIDQMDCAYVSQFSADGSLLVAGFKESRIKVYNVDNGWKVQKDIQARSLGWTITDSSLSPDQRFLVYASISPIVHIVNIGSAATESVANITEIHEGLVFADDDDGDYAFGIFSVKFSTDGREIVAGCNDNSICVYDLKANKITLRIPAHASDVNAVCFADESGHLIFSGSDDNLCKVWDRRCFTRGQEAGILAGHLEGITFIDSRGDGRYLISNGKDQAIKLWDIRKMSSNVPRIRQRDPDWDYRWTRYPNDARNLRHPHDQSLTTYKGHEVLQTLIRCYFSPAYSTGQKYIYTGSSDGSVYIYDLVTGEKVASLKYHEDNVRDCNWHPFYPMIISSSWDGAIVKWEFLGNGEAPTSVPLKRGRRRRRQFY
ncbi:LEC14B protein-like isoform X2 [Cornus florida]|uniref:LEC14B protein-like isoform X2 n=1 Tax=Cornus florida TaxID=4283 RepID=UPI002898971F|nr:LEC14B protein-like isoform X2 [Cornus florida]